LRARQGTQSLELTVPTKIIRLLELKAGTYFSVKIQDDSLVYTPVKI